MNNPFIKYEKYIYKCSKLNNINKYSINLIEESFELFKSLYNHHYGSIEEDDNLVSIHSGGWSDNEELINQFSKTWWWQSYLRITTVGGHYYFNTNVHEEKEWKIIKQ